LDACERPPLGAAAINAAPMVTIGKPSRVERDGRCEVIVFSIQLLVEPVFPGEGSRSPECDAFAAAWRKKFDGQSIRHDARGVTIN
jgi:hypothetical protein